MKRGDTPESWLAQVRGIANVFPFTGILLIVVTDVIDTFDVVFVNLFRLASQY